jgi:hypothetical protein
MKHNAFKSITLCITIGALTFSSLALAGGKTYKENEFLDKFSGKTAKVVADTLGKPFKKEQSVKPSNAGAMVGKDLNNTTSKPVKVEMWYYKNLVKYDPKHTYKETEITMVNERVMNIAFFNNK